MVLQSTNKLNDNILFLVSKLNNSKTTLSNFDFDKIIKKKYLLNS